ncbi:MAG: chemotaxis protein CheW [Pseudomonadota bacterium]
MTTYLQVRCGTYPLLMPVSEVVEIGDSVARHDQGDRRPWRDRSLRLVDLAARLGCGPGPRAGQVVVGSDGEAQAIAVVDAVIGIREFSDADFVDLAGLTPELGRLVEGVCVDDGTDRCLLRLRLPFPWLDAAAGDHA